MSSANNVIGAMAAYLTQGTAATNVSNVASVKNNSQAAGTSFDQILNKVSGSLIQNKVTDVSKQVSQTADATKQAGAATVTSNAETTVKTENTITDDSNTQEATEVIRDTAAASQTNETQDTEPDTKLQEAITEDGKELIAQIADVFDISEDEIVNAMQVLGLMAADLLQPANLQQLVTEITTGTEQAIDLITDSDIYTSLQDLMEGAESMKSELMNEFELSEESLQNAIDENNRSFDQQLQTQIEPQIQSQVQSETEAEPQMQMQPQAQEQSQPQSQTKPQAQEITDENPEVTVNVSEPELKENVNIKKTTAPQSEAFTDEAPIKEEPVQITTESSKNSSGNKGNNFQSGAESSNLFNQVMNNITQASVNVDSAAQVSYTDRAQMEDIIRQITEKITISSKAEETSMELQLHPASLGNVNVLLTSGKDGIVAKFTAQNQIVKEAVEAQMVQLQQKFDEQGIKVTSVEVTIASHGFEQNLEQGNDRNPENTAPDKKVRPLRRINLSELADDEIEELTSDADRIAASMMAVNGNSVDFSA